MHLSIYRSLLNTLLLLIACLSPATTLAQSLSIHILDVGEGQSVLIHKNQRAILIDTGHTGVATRVLKRMHDLEVKTLDYLILSHLHPDHASGYFRIHEAFPDARVLDNCHPVAQDANSDMIRWVNQALGQNPQRQCMKAGDSLDWQEVKLKTLWPLTKPPENGGINHYSLVLEISYRHQSLLLMGDADNVAELEILKTHSLGPVEILLAGHHGAADSSSEQFLQAVRPKNTVISINANNFRGYPSAQTLNRLRRYSGELYKTYQQGEIQFRFE